MNKTTCCLLLILIAGSAEANSKGVFESIPELRKKSSNAELLRVIYMPWMIKTITRVTPDHLNQNYEYEFVNKSDGYKSVVMKEFIKNLNGEYFKKSDGTNIDCRWAFTLGERNSASAITFYFNAALTKGFIRGQEFEPDESFRRWVRERFGAIFSLNSGL